MKDYDRINKIKEEKNKEIQALKDQITTLEEKLKKAEEKNQELRQKLYDAKEGKGESNRLKRIIVEKERNEKTLQNKLDKSEGKHILSTFSKENQELILKIRKLEYSTSMFNSLAYKFKDGTENVIQIAYRIKLNSADDMDFYTYAFRDDIVGLLEKILRILTQVKKSSASNYLVDLVEGKLKLPNEYLKAVPTLNDKTVLENILSLTNIQSTAYHGSRMKEKRVFINEDGSKRKYSDFLNVSKEEQLKAIFTLLRFIYYFFTSKNYEQNLINLSSYWYKTLND